VDGGQRGAGRGRVSVAFRRDGDEEHLEPKFEVPIPPGPNWVTPAGLAQIGAQVEHLGAQIATLSDEVALNAARRDLRYWQARLASAEVQPPAQGDVAGFGCNVAFKLNGKQRQIAIVGHDEADPAAGRLSFTAPLCRALMGACVGERVDFNGQDEALEVIAISPI